MSRLSQRQAAAQWGVSRITVQRYIKDGKLSVASDKRIDPVEMLRVFGEPQGGQSSPPSATPLLERIEALAIENAATKAENEALRELVRRADAERDRALDTVQRLLTHDGAPRRRWWPFGR